MDLREFIKDVKDFPKEGIIFKDISPLLANFEAFEHACQKIAASFESLDFDLIVGPESRGFIFGVGVAMVTGKGFVPVRKPGKLPGKVRSISYSLEYGTDSLEILEDSVKSGQKVLIVDDLLATGGTIGATIELCELVGANVVGCGFLIELSGLEGRRKLKTEKIESILQF